MMSKKKQKLNMTFVSLGIILLWTRNTAYPASQFPKAKPILGSIVITLLLLILNKIDYVAQQIRNFIFVSILFFIIS